MPIDIGNVERTRRDATTWMRNVPLNSAGQLDGEFIPQVMATRANFLCDSAADVAIRLIGIAGYRTLHVPAGGLVNQELAIVGLKPGNGSFSSITLFGINNEKYPDSIEGNPWSRQWGRQFGRGA